MKKTRKIKNITKHVRRQVRKNKLSRKLNNVLNKRKKYTKKRGGGLWGSTYYDSSCKSFYNPSGVAYTKDGLTKCCSFWERSLGGKCWSPWIDFSGTLLGRWMNS